MPLTGDFARLAKLRRSVQSLARPGGSGQQTLLRGIRQQVRGVLRAEFKAGVGPGGTPWQVTKQGRPAMVSKKLPGAFTDEVIAGGLRFRGSVAREWLSAHQEGHVFAARQVADRKNVMHFNRRGKLIKAKRAEKLKYGRSTLARAHTVGRRVLPARPIIPTGELPPLWQAAVELGATIGMRWWAEKASD